MTTPAWVQDAVFYQIFPDRFANGDRSNDPPNVQRWGSAPKVWAFQGGDLKGVIQKFEYLVDLGITAIYFTPIFQATSNHRYNATDYFKIDPKLGDLETFHEMIRLAHSHGVRIILDGVFNHCGRGFFAFNDILENQQYSPYLDWFHIKKLPVDAYSPGKAVDYQAWWGIKSLPKFNTDNPQVRRYLLQVAAYWIEQGADGWRLDVPNEIDDHTFWAEFRQVVKSINPEAYLLGEIWMPDPRWVGDQHFDGLMNYPVRRAILELLDNNRLNAAGFADTLTQLMDIFPRENFYSMYVPLGSHDTERILTRLGGDNRKVQLAYLLQFSLPGAPAVYYGDEIGLKGRKDPGCRGAFPWNEKRWNQDLLHWVKKLISVRKEIEPLRRGDIHFLAVNQTPELLAFVRGNTEEKVLIVVNPTDVEYQIDLPLKELGWPEVSRMRSLLSTKEYLVSQEAVHLGVEPWSGDWLI